MRPTDEVIEGTEDLYPKGQQAHQEMVARVNEMFTAAQAARRPYEDRWKRFYRLFRSYVTKPAGDWSSKVFVPIIFYTIQSILPRVTAALPKMLCYPVDEDDVDGAKQMEELLEWSSNQSGLDLELVKAAQDALMYGTGILKTFHARRPGVSVKQYEKTEQQMIEQVPEPIMDPAGAPMMDLDGNPMMTEAQQVPLTDEMEQPVEIGTGEYVTEKETFDLYNGPAAECIDIFNFWTAPEATSMEDARFVIQRVYRDRKYILDKIEEGVYRWPDHIEEGDFGDTPDDPQAERLGEVGLDGGRRTDPTRKAIEIHEVWTDDQVITMANKSIIVRVAENPFAHGDKPYVRQVDYLVPHEFWGIGETEILEGLQDVINAMTNQRIDNVRLLMNAMFLINRNYVKDMSELKWRPGGVISTHGADGIPLEQLVARLDVGDVTSSAYEEVAEAERLTEKVSGVSAYTTGTDSPEMNETATGVALISEQGNTRFAQKIRIAELTGLKRLARHFGCILQQFMPPEMVLRIQGPDGAFVFEALTPESIEGSFDYDIEAESSTVTESVRRDQSMTLFQLFANDPLINQQAIREDVLRSFGKKDIRRFIAPALGGQIDPMTGMPIDPMAAQDPMTAAMGPVPNGDQPQLSPVA